MSSLFKFIEENILYVILLISWLQFLWKLYLNLRQRSLMIRSVEVPKSVEYLMTKDIYDKSRKYDLDKLNFTIFEDIYSEVWSVVFLLGLFYYHFWLWSISVVEYFGFDDTNEILLSGICMFMVNSIFTVMYFPLKMYSTFVVEEKHGFNKQTLLFFIKDQLLKFAVGEVIAIPLLCAIIWIVKNGGDYTFIYLWLFLIIATLVLMIIYPEVIAPLFNKYTALPEGDLKMKIEALAASINFPLYKLFLVDNSRRSSHSNAYLYGFYKYKRIVLFDTLVKEYYKPAKDEIEPKGCDTDEVLAVLAHELGHWKYNHALKGFMITQVHLLLDIFLYAKLISYKPMFYAFGFVDTQPTIIGFIIVTMCILLPSNLLLQFVTVIIQRKFEFEADKFAKIIGHGQALKRSLIKLHKDNLSFPLYDKLYSRWHHSHPPFLERLEAIDKEE